MTLEIRPLASQSDIEACIALQKEIWGLDDLGVMSPITLKALTMTEPAMSVLLGGFMDGRLIGFSLTMGAIAPEAAYGHMLGVLPEFQNHGVGGTLQQTVQDTLKDHGIKRMYWTFEPLESRNSYLYLNKVGGIATAYEENHYHVENQMQKDLPLDRMVISLDLASPNIATTVISPNDAMKLYPVATTDHMPNSSAVLVPIPTNLTDILESAPDAALRMRLETRELFNEYINKRRYKGVQVINGHKYGSPTSYYILKKDT